MGRTLYLVHQVLPTMPGLGRPALMLALALAVAGITLSAMSGLPALPEWPACYAHLRTLAHSRRLHDEEVGSPLD